MPLSPVDDHFRTLVAADSLNRWFGNARRATYAWCAFVSLYWTLLVVLPGLINNTLNQYPYFTWFCGMVGVCSVYYCTRADHAADSPAGKPVMAMTCVAISVDWSIHAFVALQSENDIFTTWQVIIIFFHSLTIAWASLFFYNRAVKNGKKVAWFSLLLQWFDLVFMAISILVLHFEEEDCAAEDTCTVIENCKWGYFVVLVANLVFWFFPIMFGFADTEKHIHLHMVILDSLSDLPLVVIIMVTDAYDVHWWIFIDIAYKLFMLLRTYAYHLIINLVLRHKELDTLQKQQSRIIKMETEAFDQGKSDEEIQRATTQFLEEEHAKSAGRSVDV